MTDADLCPMCIVKGKVNRLVAVIYKQQESYYTCEDKNCIYFLTDNEGNLLKFHSNDNRELHKTQISTNKSCDSRNEDYLDELLKSFPEECKNQESDIPFFSSNNYCNTNILKSDVSVANQNKSGLCEINDNFDIDELINEVLQ